MFFSKNCSRNKNGAIQFSREDARNSALKTVNMITNSPVNTKSSIISTLGSNAKPSNAQFQNEDLWSLLDDGDDKLTLDEFCNGMAKMKGELQTKDLMDMSKTLSETMNTGLSLAQQVQEVQDKLEKQQSDLAEVAADIKTVQWTCQTVCRQLHPSNFGY